LVVPKRRCKTTTQHCIICQKFADLFQCVFFLKIPVSKFPILLSSPIYLTKKIRLFCHVFTCVCVCLQGVVFYFHGFLYRFLSSHLQNTIVL
jgi:hypothetical protein